MTRPSILIIGGGLAGLSTGCYALANGWETTIVEHNLALGGVCTAWHRGPYTVDGCIHWLTGGPFSKIYEELQIVPPVAIRPLTEFATIRSARDGWSVTVRADLQGFAGDLKALAPEDGAAIDEMIAVASRVPEIAPPIESPPELTSLGAQLRMLWDMRHELGTFARHRGTVGAWVSEHFKSPAARTALLGLVPPEAPALFLLMMLGYLERGWLSRPVGGTGAFRDALVARYAALGGACRVDSTVDEVLVERDRAVGVRLDDGTILRGDLVVSTSSAPETVLRLLGGRYGADELRERMDTWKLFDPIVLASWGVARSLADAPQTLSVSEVDGRVLGGRAVDRFTVRVYNDEPSIAPPGHTVVQMLVNTDYEWWATRGVRYGDAKAEFARAALELLDPHFPGIADDVRMTDVATPITYWRSARTWRGAFEGWMPSADNFRTHVAKSLPGLRGFYMAGQWVEPGGGVPTALMSGRQLVQILCDAADRPFVAAPQRAR
ncbi:MAG: NAD(P)/FAD-dependent oxidoreductase [Nannocystaceae bacterium]